MACILWVKKIIGAASLNHFLKVNKKINVLNEQGEKSTKNEFYWICKVSLKKYFKDDLKLKFLKHSLNADAIECNNFMNLYYFLIFISFYSVPYPYDYTFSFDSYNFKAPKTYNMLHFWEQRVYIRFKSE